MRTAIRVAAYDVRVCGECPFQRDGYCTHSSRAAVGLVDENRVDEHRCSASPEWCPLKTAPTLVRFKVAT